MRFSTLLASGIVGASAIASLASAQEAVQWRVEDGGNGHWYQLIVHPTGLNWNQARGSAHARGGDLASLGAAGAATFARSIFFAGICGGSTGQAGPYVGGYQDVTAPDYLEPDGGWRWVDGSPFPGAAELSTDDSGGSQNYLQFISLNSGCTGPFWIDDVGTQSQNRSYIVEWSTDCNDDGIVDYGQIRAGELEDSNANNVPDCCESGAACTPNLLVNGGFEIGATQLDCTWVIHSANSAFVPGWSVVSASVDRVRLSAACPIGTESWTSFGGEFTIDLDGWSAGGAIAQTVATRSGRAYRVTFQLTGNCGDLSYKPMRVEIGSGSWGFVHTCQPTNPQPWNEKSVEFVASGPATTIVLRSLMTDGGNGPIVDAVRLEEIVQECPADVDASGAVNAIDLAIILGNWGTDGGKYPGADVDGNGTVDALDLAEVLNGWGPCF